MQLSRSSSTPSLCSSQQPFEYATWIDNEINLDPVGNNKNDQSMECRAWQQAATAIDDGQMVNVYVALYRALASQT